MKCKKKSSVYTLEKKYHLMLYAVVHNYQSICFGTCLTKLYIFNKDFTKKNVCQGNTRTPNIRFYALAWLTVFKKVWNYGIQNNIVTIPTIMTYLTHIIFLRNSKFYGDSSYFHATYLIFTVNDSSYVLLNFALNFFLNFSTRIEWKFEWIMCGEFVWNSHLRY